MTGPAGKPWGHRDITGSGKKSADFFQGLMSADGGMLRETRALGPSRQQLSKLALDGPWCMSTQTVRQPSIVMDLMGQTNRKMMPFPLNALNFHFQPLPGGREGSLNELERQTNTMVGA